MLRTYSNTEHNRNTHIKEPFCWLSTADFSHCISATTILHFNPVYISTVSFPEIWYNPLRPTGCVTGWNTGNCTQAPVRWMTGPLCPRLKPQGFECDHSPPASVEVRNARSYALASTCTYMARWLIENAHSFVCRKVFPSIGFCFRFLDCRVSQPSQILFLYVSKPNIQLFCAVCSI